MAGLRLDRVRCECLWIIALFKKGFRGSSARDGKGRKMIEKRKESVNELDIERERPKIWRSDRWRGIGGGMGRKHRTE